MTAHLFICKMVEENVIKCISSMLDNGVFLIETLRSEIEAVTEYLLTLCQSLDNLEEFLVHYDDHFMVENGKVCDYDSQLDSGRENAADYYEAELKKEMEKHGEWPYYQNFRGHIGQASQDIQNYLNTFYPEEEFKDFLLEYPDVFEVLDDDTVCLIESECVDYFETYLQNGGISIPALRRYIFYNAAAPDHIRGYMSRNYDEDDFLDFFYNNSETFYIEDGYVYLNWKCIRFL